MGGIVRSDGVAQFLSYFPIVGQHLLMTSPTRQNATQRRQDIIGGEAVGQ